MEQKISQGFLKVRKPSFIFQVEVQHHKLKKFSGILSQKRELLLAMDNTIELEQQKPDIVEDFNAVNNNLIKVLDKTITKVADQQQHIERLTTEINEMKQNMALLILQNKQILQLLKKD